MTERGIQGQVVVFLLLPEGAKISEKCIGPDTPVGVIGAIAGIKGQAGTDKRDGSRRAIHWL